MYTFLLIFVSSLSVLSTERVVAGTTVSSKVSDCVDSISKIQKGSIQFTVKNKSLLNDTFHVFTNRLIFDYVGGRDSFAFVLSYENGNMAMYDMKKYYFFSAKKNIIYESVLPWKAIRIKHLWEMCEYLTDQGSTMQMVLKSNYKSYYSKDSHIPTTNQSHELLVEEYEVAVKDDANEDDTVFVTFHFQNGNILPVVSKESCMFAGEKQIRETLLINFRSDADRNYYSEISNTISSLIQKYGVNVR